MIARVRSIDKGTTTHKSNIRTCLLLLEPYLWPKLQNSCSLPEADDPVPLLTGVMV